MGFNRFVLLHAGRKLLHRPPRSTSVVRLCNAHDRISRYHVTHRCLCILSKLFLFFSEFSSDRHVSYNDHGRLLCLRKSMAQIVISIELHERATWARIVLCLRVEERADSLRWAHRLRLVDASFPRQPARTTGTLTARTIIHGKKRATNLLVPSGCCCLLIVSFIIVFMLNLFRVVLGLEQVAG